MKLLEENTGVNLHNLGFSNGFLEMTPKAHTKKEKKQIHWTYLKLKSFCVSEDTINKIK